MGKDSGHEEETYEEEYEEVVSVSKEEEEEGWSEYDEQIAIDRKVRHQNKKKKASHPSNPISRPLLCAISWGRGGIHTTSLYHEEWNKIEFLVTGFSRSKFKRVESKEKGKIFIRIFF